MGCVARTVPQPTAAAPKCPVCARPLQNEAVCGNPVCGWGHRHIGRVEAVCLKTGPVDRLLKDFKYGRVGLGWKVIFGRLVLGWLAENHGPDDFDLIVANPTHPARRVRHTEQILAAAANQDVHDQWPFDRGDPRAIVKAKETAPSATQPWRDKKAAADALWEALEVPDPQRTEGRRILVLDDIATTLLQLNAVAGILKETGRASTVDGLVIARAVLPGRQ
jgi:predicted amidophosphoribosyltransferase